MSFAQFALKNTLPLPKIKVTMIEIENLSKVFRGKRFKKVQAVDGVSFAVRDGEVLGLLGPNGAGKTTIMRLLGTVLKPSAGAAHVGGFDVRQARIDELITILDMGEYADRPCKRFSKGMSQKVALARALIHDPAHLLLDEPTAGLDVMSARQVRKLITDSRAAGKCVIVSTHILSEAERLCDRLIFLDHGQVVAKGTPAELCQQSGVDSLEDAFVKTVGRKNVELAE
jgi:sodium transport system ATP-binding protein